MSGLTNRRGSSRLRRISRPTIGGIRYARRQPEPVACRDRTTGSLAPRTSVPATSSRFSPPSGSPRKWDRYRPGLLILSSAQRERTSNLRNIATRFGTSRGANCCLQTLYVWRSSQNAAAPQANKSVERHAAAHRDGLAGHIGIVDKHYHGFCDFVGGSEAPQWNPAHQCRLPLHHVGF